MIALVGETGPNVNPARKNRRPGNITRPPVRSRQVAQPHRAKGVPIVSGGK